MYFDPSDWFEEEVDLYDEYEQSAETRVLEIISQQQVVTDRELKVRLEREFFPWVTGRALKKLVDGGSVRLVKAPGRKGRMGTPDNFYMDPSLQYYDILPTLLRKKDVSYLINSQLTRAAPAGFFAEEVFGSAFISLGFKILDRDASTFGEKNVKSVRGKEPPNLDFILRKNEVTYGVDIKNWIKYEFDTVRDVMFKVSLSLQLGIIPFICARYVDKSAIHKVAQNGGMIYRYDTLILPPDLASLARNATALLGYPILASNTLPDYKLSFINRLHDRMKRILSQKK